MKFLRIVFLSLLVFAGLSVFGQSRANAQSSADLKKQRDRLNEELDQLNHQYQETVNNKKTTLKQLNILKAKISVREEEIKTINTQVRVLDNQITESNNNVHNLQNQLAQLKKEYAAMILFAYRNQSGYNKMMFLFASKDFNQAFKRMKYLQQFGDYRQRQAAYIQGTETELHVKINQLDQNKKEKSALLADQQTQVKSLGKERSDQAQVMDDLSHQEGQIKEQQKDLIRRRAKTEHELQAAIRREIEEARRKAEEEARAREAAAEKARLAAAAANAANGNRDVTPAAKPRITPKTATTSEILNATPELARLSNSFLGNKGRLPWPVANGNVIQGFGIYYVDGIKSENSGVNIRTNAGANVRAIFDGEVTKVANISGTYLVVIRHGEYFTAYSNLKSAAVSAGQKVTTKQIVGTAATDAGSGETEVDFSLYQGKTPVNPAVWLAPN